jgi:ADP-ribose pyrophosphatase YjhB (NUDIX family)
MGPDMHREYPEQPIIGVGGAIFYGQSVLLAKRTNPPFQGQWSLPGGAVELGETLEDALKREIWEETSINIETGGLIRLVNRIIYDDNKKIQFHYVIAGYWGWTSSDKPIANSDISEIIYADIDRISSFQLDSDTLETISLGLEAYRAWSKEHGV